MEEAESVAKIAESGDCGASVKAIRKTARKLARAAIWL